MADERPLRVAVLGRSVYALHGVGGLERHLYDLLRHHLAAGWRVTLVTRTPATPQGVEPERWRLVADHPCFSACFVPYRTFPLAGRRGTTILDRSTAYPVFGRRAGTVAVQLAARGDVDIVYGVGASAWGYASARARGARAPLVFNPQGLEEFGGADGRYGGQRLKGLAYAPLQAVVRRTARASDAVIATDEAIRPAVLRHLPVDANAVRVIPNGIDVQDLDRLVDPAAGRAVRRRAAIGDDSVLLVSVGRIEANKGFADLAAALALLPAAVAWRWVLVGDGPARPALEHTLRASGIASRVLITGRVDDRTLHAWYDAADLFVHPTRYEGSSLVTLEAMLH
ncbi:MAG TPA: glycosyltransferase family 4 protein, partial [Vicinamibacterales bacterium]